MAYTFKHGDRPLEGYTIQRGIGRGGFGEVYYAISDGGREVALKYLRDNSEIELRGVSHCMNLKSPYLVTIFDVVKNAEGEYFIIMEHVSGPSLRDLLIAEPKGLGLEKAAFFLREIGKGLGYLHDRGIVHRDMKPANIFFEEGHVKIGDYGLSKFISVSRHSVQTTSVGTVHYMAPEVGSGNYHRGIDIYALGVMLYEMMLGKVPFEGSSMGEILMKHLTEQAEVTGLPEPFGKVIRKALEKDPRDRYQTVHEMIDDMLEVSEVRDSLAGFNPSTITAVPRQPVGSAMDSPVPSPNPLGPPPPLQSPETVGGFHIGGVPLPSRIGKRLRKISERIERKMDRLAGRPHRPRPKPALAPGGAPQPQAGRRGILLASTPKRIMLAFLLTAMVSIGMGLLLGAGTGEELAGVSSGLMIAAMTLGLRLAPRVTPWLGTGAQPRWVEKMVLIGCCAPLMMIANTPVVEEYGGSGFALFLGMVFVLLVGDWKGRRESGSQGNLSFGKAFSLAICGGLACVIAAAILEARDEDEFLVMGAGIGGVVSLLTQALAWFLRKPTVAAVAGAATPPGPAADAPAPPPPAVNVEQHHRLDVPYAIPVEPGTPASGMASTRPMVRMRSVFERGCFSVVAFIMLFSTVANVIYAALVSMHRDELFAHVIGAAASFSIMLFTAQKLTLRKRNGFWRETLCPFLIAVFMTALGACIGVVAIMNLNDSEFACAVIGIIFAGLGFLALMVARIWPLFGRLDLSVDKLGDQAAQWLKDNVAVGVIGIGGDEADQAKATAKESGETDFKA